MLFTTYALILILEDYLINIESQTNNLNFVCLKQR